jgi:hypothetical protein
MFNVVDKILEGADITKTLATAYRLQEASDGDIDKLCDDADKELKKVIQWFKDNEDAFKIQDLKLHDAAFYDIDKNFPLVRKALDTELFGRGWDPFNDFCTDSYDNFIDWCQEQGINFEKMTKAVWGSNSKFYLDKSDMIELEGNRGREQDISIQSTIDNLVDYFGYEGSFNVNEDGLVDRDYVKDWYETDEYVVLNLKDIASGQFFKDIKEHYEDVIKVYDYIKSFKDNQVENYENWLEYETEWLQENYPELTEEA